MSYKELDWDTRLLGEKVAAISHSVHDAHELRDVLTSLRKNQTRLAYWTSAKKLSESDAADLSGQLVDKKTTFVISLEKVDHEREIPTGLVSPYNSSMSLTELESLAIQSGKYSRFGVDPNFPDEKFIELYSTWIRRSVNKELAQEVLVIEDKGHIAGMATLGCKNTRGDIGLLAVDEHYRGRGYGKTLIKAAQNWFLDHDFKTGQVVTQGDNIPACRLYEACGYSIESVQYYYHFWL